MCYCACLFLLILLLCNSHFNGATATSDSNSKTIEEHSTKNATSKITFIDLNFDVLIIIFEQLDLVDLTNVASIHSTYRSIAHGLFRRKYQNCQIEVIDTEQLTRIEMFSIVNKQTRNQAVFLIKSVDSNVAQNKKQFFQHFQSVYIIDYDYPKKFLWYFGDLFQKMTFNFRDVESMRYYNYHNLLYAYCPDTIRHLDLIKIEDMEFKMPFKRLEHLTMEMTIRIARGKFILPFNELFPVLKTLNIKPGLHLRYDFINYTLPYLKCFKIEAAAIDTYRSANEITDVLMKNPQICSFDIRNGYGFPNGYVKIINKYLRNLENLTITTIDYVGDGIYFGHMKNLHVNSIDMKILKNITMPNLESLNLGSVIEGVNEWRAFFQRHNKLQKLTLSYIRDDQFIEIITDLHNLMEIMIGRCASISIETVANIVKNHPTLMKIEFPVRRHVDVGNVREQFENEWNISENNSFYTVGTVLLERKN